jgi:hypothetical protein
MQILPAKKVAQILGKNLRWVYANAPQLGGLKVGGSWIFTRANLERALTLQGQPPSPEPATPKPAPSRGRPRARRPPARPPNVEPELVGLARELGLEWLVE